MAARSGIEIDGLKALRRDLRAVNRQADRDVVRGLKGAVQSTVVPKAAALAPGVRLGPSLRVGVVGGTVHIRSRLPHARVVHWGLRHPLFGNREHWYANPKDPFILDAVRGSEGEILDAMADAVEGALRRNGFR